MSSRTDQPYVAIPIEVTSREWGRAQVLFDERRLRPRMAGVSRC